MHLHGSIFKNKAFNNFLAKNIRIVLKKELLDWIIFHWNEQIH